MIGYEIHNFIHSPPKFCLELHCIVKSDTKYMLHKKMKSEGVP